MRVLVLGAHGMLARDLIAQAPGDVELVAKTRSELDVTDEPTVTAAVADAEPDVIINGAAYTNVDGAEAEPERAFAVNGRAPGVVGRAASAAAPRSPLPPLVVHFSTDYVFNGGSSHPYREGDHTEPLGVYGASKLAGERALAESGAGCLIVRTSWLFGRHGRSFPRTMWERAGDRKATRVVNDQRGRPTYTVDLARAVWRLVSGERGAVSGRRSAPRADPLTADGSPLTLHVANTGEATWYDVAKRVFETAGVPDLVSPCTTADYPTPARRPAYSVLDTTRYDTLSGCSLPRWEDAIDRFLTELSRV